MGLEPRGWARLPPAGGNVLFPREEDQVLKSEQAQRHANGWRHDEDAVQRRAQATSCYCRADSNGRVGRPVKCVSQARQRPGPLRALGLINCSADDLIRKLAPWVPTQNVNWRGEASRLAKRAPCWEWRELVGGLAQPRSLWGHKQVISLMGLSFLFFVEPLSQTFTFTMGLGCLLHW